jgi:DNA-binding NarL/FixJ family response regulator
MSVARILVVDDFLPWLLSVQQMLQSETDLSIVATATDGPRAIDKAMELQPEVILMDLGLPGMNGLEATRQIRQRCPACRVLFLTGDHSPQLIAAAFQAGGLGYVWKTDSHLDLLAGIRAVLRGESFVSRSLANWRDFSG